MKRKKTSTRGRRQKDSGEPTEAEWEVLKVVWAQQPCTAGAVQEALVDSKQWAYSTVKTTMDRMVEKGLLDVERLRNLQLFRATLSEVDGKLGEFRKMLKRTFDGAFAPMMEFLFEHNGLSTEEADELRHLIRASKDKG